MYRRIAAEEGFDSVDYWKIGEAMGKSFMRLPDAIHPADIPSTRVMLDFMLEKVYRWHTYG
jgi:hypothetical protein